MEPSGDIRSGNAKSRGRTAYLAPRGGREKNPEGSAQALEKSRFAEANERIFLPFSFLLLPPFLSPASRLFSFPSLHSRHVIAALHLWIVRLGCRFPRIVLARKMGAGWRDRFWMERELASYLDPSSCPDGLEHER